MCSKILAIGVKNSNTAFHATRELSCALKRVRIAQPLRVVLTVTCGLVATPQPPRGRLKALSLRCGRLGERDVCVACLADAVRARVLCHLQQRRQRPA